MGEDSEAIEYYELAIESAINSVGIKHPDTKIYAKNLCALLQMKCIEAKNDDQLDRAVEMLEKQIEVESKVYGESNLWIALQLNDLGTLFSANEEYGRAVGCFSRALEVMDPNAPNTKTVKQNLINARVLSWGGGVGVSP